MILFDDGRDMPDSNICTCGAHTMFEQCQDCYILESEWRDEQQRLAEEQENLEMLREVYSQGGHYYHNRNY